MGTQGGAGVREAGGPATPLGPCWACPLCGGAWLRIRRTVQAEPGKGATRRAGRAASRDGQGGQPRGCFHWSASCRSVQQAVGPPTQQLPHCIQPPS